MIPYYLLAMRQISQKVHRDLNLTPLLGIREQLAGAFPGNAQWPATLGRVGE
jgi:hypothetical protein